jgi:hypothetical protein
LAGGVLQVVRESLPPLPEDAVPVPQPQVIDSDTIPVPASPDFAGAPPLILPAPTEMIDRSPQLVLSPARDCAATPENTSEIMIMKCTGCIIGPPLVTTLDAAAYPEVTTISPAAYVAQWPRWQYVSDIEHFLTLSLGGGGVGRQEGESEKEENAYDLWSEEDDSKLVELFLANS